MQDTGIKIHPEVAAAISEGAAVVALESTIISHGLPRPQNLLAARAFEELLRAQNVVPATIAVIAGTPTVGLAEDELELIANQDIPKASVRDLPILRAKGLSGATTVAATAYLAAKAGVKVFATGGLGGVHRGASETFDESADLTTLASAPVVVVSAGVKSVLDIGATLERMESLSIPVVGYKTDVFPAFWLYALPVDDFPYVHQLLGFFAIGGVATGACIWLSTMVPACFRSYYDGVPGACDAFKLGPKYDPFRPELARYSASLLPTLPAP